MEGERTPQSGGRWDAADFSVGGARVRVTNWVRDDCERGYVYAINPERARGILKIHASCEPPCPRKRTAAAYLGDARSSLD